jgi:DNA-binding transcriptional MerR regulator
MPQPLGFPIGYVSSQTGLSSHVLRAWERRHKAILPQRSKGRRRLYTVSDIDRLMLLKQAIGQGHRISTIAALETSELIDLIHATPKHRPALPVSCEPPVGSDVQDAIHACMQAVTALDGMELKRLLQDAAVCYSRYDWLEYIVRPLMERVGRRWSQGKLRIVHAQRASEVVHAHLVRMLDGPVDYGAQQLCLLVATPSGQHCCIGALAVSLIAQDHGWHPVFLGANLPAEEIAAACFLLGPKVIALSITCRFDDRFMANELNRLCGFLDGRCSLVIGGRASRAYRRQVEDAGAVWATTETFIQLLQ